MSDAKPIDHSAMSPRSVPAIVTYWLLAIWSAMILAVFAMVAFQVPIEGVMLGILSGLIGTQTTLLVAAVSFWVGSTVGSRQKGDDAAADATIKTAALAQLAGAGPQPPEKPLGVDAEKVVTT